MAEERVQRRLAAILAADVVGYGRLMEQDEAGTLAALKARRRGVLEPLVARHQGRIFKVTGDGVLIEFASAVNAVQCAVDLQHSMADANGDQTDDRHIVLRIGVNLGDVMVEGSDLYGDGVNVAARLEALAEPGSILVSGTAYDYVRNKVKVAFDDLGPKTLKNIAEPVRAYRAADMPAVAIRPPKATTDKPSIAVLPFTNMSGDTEQQYFSDGITEDIITELSRFRSLLVIARNSSFQYRNAADAKHIAQQLGVQYLVEGSVRRSGDRIRVTAQLIEATSGNHLWAERYDRDLRDTFTVQDEVTRTIVSTLAVRLEDEGLAVAKRRPPESMRAYDCWLRGKKCLPLWTRRANDEARGLFLKAVELDPGFARAYAGLALTYEWATWYSAWGAGDPTTRDTAEQYALKAMRLDPVDHEPHVVLGWINHDRRDFERSRRHLDRAEALNPNDADMLINKAMILSCDGDGEAAIELARSAIRLNPYHSDWYLGVLSHCYLVARRYGEAIALREGLTSTLPEGHAYMAVLYVLLGQLDEAKRHVEKLVAEFSSHWIGRPSASFFVNLMVYRRQEDADIVFDALCKAGLPG